MRPARACTARACTARDVQASRVYLWEDAMGWRALGRFRDEEEARGFLARLYEPLRFSPPVLLVNPRLRSRCWFHCKGRTIHLAPGWGLEAGIVMHEAAHDMTSRIIVPRHGEQAIAWHGAQFVGILGEMVAAFSGRNSAIIRENAQSNGIGWKQPPPSVQRAVDSLRRGRRARGWLREIGNG